MPEKTYDLHPIVDLFPDMTEAGMEVLTESIRKKGLKVPLLLAPDPSDGGRWKVADGKNRLRACEAAGVEPKFEKWDQEGSLVDLLVTLNYDRRHLTPSQRAAVGGRIAEAKSAEIRAERKARRSAGEDFSENRKEPRNAVREAAKAVGVATSYVSDARAIARTSPEAAEEVRRGQKTISEAKRELGLDVPKNPRRSIADQVFPPGRCKVNGILIPDPPDIARQRASGVIPPGVVLDLEETPVASGTAASAAAVAEEYAERAAIQDDIPDEEWLAGFPLRGELSGAQRTTFDWNARKYRRVEPVLRSLKARLLEGLPKRQRRGPLIGRAIALVRLADPGKWLGCPEPKDGGCGGAGSIEGVECPKCRGAGFWIPH